MPWFVVFFVCAVLWGQTYYGAIHLGWLVAAGCMAVVAAVLAWRAALKAARLSLGLACALAGFYWGALGVQQLALQQLPAEWENSQWQADVSVKNLKTTSGGNVQLWVQVDKLQCEHKCPPVEGKALVLSWYQGPAVAPGERWRLQLKLRRLDTFANPHAFDFHAYQLRQGLYAQAGVKEGVLIGKDDASWTQRWRQALQRVMTGQALGEPVRFGRFYAALAFGDTSAMSWEDWQVLQRTGTVHLMAISGFQVGLFAGVGFFLGGLLARIPNLWQRYSGVLALRLLPWLGSVGLAWVYTALANYAVPAERALVAVGVMNTAWLLGWRPSPFAVLVWAAGWAALTEPLLVLNAGFWLSYVGVLTLLAVFTCVRGFRSLVREGLHAQAVMTLVLLVPLLALSIPISLSSPLANLLFGPLVSVVVTPGVFLVWPAQVMGLDGPLLRLLDAVFGVSWWGLTQLSHWPLSLWWPSKPLGWAEWGLGVLATGLLLWPRGLGLRGLGVLLMAVCLLLPAQTRRGLKLVVLDVGQGLAAVVQTPRHTLLYDVGPRYSPQFDAGTGIVVPYLLGEGLRKADVLLSHDDGGHLGGWRGIEVALPVQVLGTGERLGYLPLAPQCHRGQAWQYDDVHFKVLWPPMPSLHYGNNRSCVVLLRYGQQSVLLMADSEKAVEHELLALGDIPSGVSVLLVPNHGSPSASSANFVAHLRPQWVVYATALHNVYRQPNAKVVALYDAVSAKGFNTAYQGAVTFYWPSSEAQPQITTQRGNSPRPWYRQEALTPRPSPSM